MRTIHIKHHKPGGWLLRELYKKYLKDDPLWHFVYWEGGWTHKVRVEGQNLIIRISDPKILRKVKKHLKGLPETSYEEYEFPHPRKWWQLGILNKSWEAKHPNVALPMLHAIAEARMNMKRKTYRKFLQQFLHIGANVYGWDHADEAQIYLERVHGCLEVVKNWYHRR